MFELKEKMRTLEPVFLNCYCTYFLSFCNYHSDTKSRNDSIIFLSQGVRDYISLDIAQVKERHQNENPWFYQPLTLNFIDPYDNSMKNVDDIDFLMNFNLGYLKENFQIDSGYYTDCSWGETEKLIFNNLGSGSLAVISIDEVFNPYSPKWYKKNSNRHGIAVIDYDYNKKEFIILDSNIQNEYYRLSYDDLYKAYVSNFGMKVVFTLNISKFENKLDIEPIISDFFEKEKYRADYLVPLLKQFKSNLELYKQGMIEDFKYVFRGMASNITAKMLPYDNMIVHLMKKAAPAVPEDMDYYIKKKQSYISEWKMIVGIIHKMLDDCDFNKLSIIIERIEKLVNKELKLVNYIQSINPVL